MFGRCFFFFILFYFLKVIWAFKVLTVVSYPETNFLIEICFKWQHEAFKGLVGDSCFCLIRFFFFN